MRMIKCTIPQIHRNRPDVTSAVTVLNTIPPRGVERHPLQTVIPDGFLKLSLDVAKIVASRVLEDPELRRVVESWPRAGLVEDLTAQSKSERGKTARQAVKSRNPVKKSDMQDDASRKSPDKTGIRTKAAKRAKVSERKVKQAQKVRKEAPQLIPQIESGDLTLADAARETAKRELAGIESPR